MTDASPPTLTISFVMPATVGGVLSTTKRSLSRSVRSAPGPGRSIVHRRRQFSNNKRHRAGKSYPRIEALLDLIFQKFPVAFTLAAIVDGIDQLVFVVIFRVPQHALITLLRKPCGGASKRGDSVAVRCEVDVAPAAGGCRSCTGAACGGEPCWPPNPVTRTPGFCSAIPVIRGAVFLASTPRSPRRVRARGRCHRRSTGFPLHEPRSRTFRHRAVAMGPTMGSSYSRDRKCCRSVRRARRRQTRRHCPAANLRHRGRGR